MNEHMVSGVLPILALRGIVIFPDQTVHFDIGRVKSVRALEAAMKENQTIMLVPQKDIVEDDPNLSGLFSLGTVAKVKQVLKTQGDNLRILVTGLCRAHIVALQQTEPYLQGMVESVAEQKSADSARNQALCREANLIYGAYTELTEHGPQAVQLRMLASNDVGFIADTIAQNSGIDYVDKVKILCQLNPVRRLEMTLRLLHREVEMLQYEAEIQQKTHDNIDKNQKEYYLREQLRVIHEELGDGEDLSEFDDYRNKVLALKLPRKSEEKVLKDISRLRKQPFGSSEAAVLRNYLDTLLELPWNTKTKEKLDVSAVRKVLDKDHYGLEKVKERILETIAVRQMAPEIPAQIICLVGPPGVGKTSIAYSIARSLNRKMARIALGGVHDEAEIRGHRKTYVGAMPGRIMAAMSQAGSSNPLLLLDEIDKLGADHRGDPSAALLEVLDAEQNKTYQDHYLEIPYDLSDVMFITTANTLDTVPRALLDRMEVIELNSYTDEEKLMITKNHLLPKQLKKHGLKKSQLKITDGAIREMITCYTRESGVRNLERSLAQLCRKVDMRLLGEDGLTKITVNAGDLEQYLGVRRYLPDRMARSNEIGLVTGLAWTSVGGETLEVEVNVMDGNGKLELTGNLGNVMKESVQAALSYIRANAKKLGISADFYKTKDIHVHFPEGAVPKDGPSAGITVCTAMVSALTGTPVRRDVAMTGEISLRGRVMAIGGLKEKTMAAMRHGITTVIIPEANRKDLEMIDPTVRKALSFVTAEKVEMVLDTALVHHVDANAPLLNDIPKDISGRIHKPSIRQ